MEFKRDVYYKAGQDLSSDIVKIHEQDEKGNSVVELKCSKCGGLGTIPSFNYVEDGICFKCQGHKTSMKVVKLYTKEEAQKLMNKYHAKKEKERVEQQAKDASTLQEFFPNNKAYVCNDSNSYELREQLKESGYRFYDGIAWVGIKDIDFASTVEINADEYFIARNNRLHVLDCLSLSVASRPIVEATPFYGEVGNKLEFTFKFTRLSNYHTQYGTTYIYHLELDKYKFAWKTNKLVDVDIDAEITLKGTIKAHETYRQENITYLTRCKVVA